LADAAWLSLYGEEKPQGLAAEFVEYILQRAEEDMKRLGGSWRGQGEGHLNARGFEKAEVDDVKGEYAITYGRYGTDNKALDYAVARADAFDGRETDAERFSALSTLTSCVFLVPGGRLTIPRAVWVQLSSNWTVAQPAPGYMMCSLRHLLEHTRFKTSAEKGGGKKLYAV